MPPHAPRPRASSRRRRPGRPASKAVTNHTARLQELLADGTAKALEQLKRLTDASAEHNVGQVNRNVNIPTMAMRFLEPARAGSVQFYGAGTEMIEGLETAIIEFVEVGVPTVVRGANDASVPATGRYWIDPATGAVLRAHVEFGGPDLAGRLEIDLMRHNAVAAWVPRTMTESWRTKGQRITGLATYDRYQRLVVATGEIVK